MGWKDAPVVGAAPPQAGASSAQPAWSSAPVVQAPAKGPGLLERVGDVFTGQLRQTAETEAAPDWSDMPELNSFTVASAKTGLGTLLSNPQETVQVIQANFPGVQVRQDDKGNFLLRSSMDGREYAIKPGFRASDIPRAAGAIAAFTPAGRATSIIGAGTAGAATQALIEGSQALTGGEFNPSEVALAGAAGAAVPAVVNTVKAVAPPARQLLQRATGRNVPEVQPGAAPGATPPVPPVAAAQPLTAQELGATARKAAEGWLGAGGAKRVLAEQASPDAKVTDAAKRLGIEEYLQPDHVTTNQAYRELAQAVKSVPGSEARAAELAGLDSVAKRADDLIDEIGGTTDVSALNANVKGRLQATQAELEAKADKLYDELRTAVPAKSSSPATTVLEFIEQRAQDLGGRQNLSAMEKQIVGKLAPRSGRQPTYALLDDVRKDLGAAARQAGPFKDADTGLSKKLYALLSDDQAAVVAQHGMGDTYNAARQAVAVRKGIEDDLVALFGKNIDESLVGDLSGAVGALPKGDTSKFIKLLKAIPEDMRQNVVASGLNAAFGKSAKNGALNFNSYAKWYEGLLRNKQAYAALMSNLPRPARKQLSDLYRVSRGISAATKERITTGRIQAVADEIKGADTLIGNLYRFAKRAAVAVPAEAVTTTMGLPGSGAAAVLASAFTKGKTNVMRAADELIASPEFVQMAKSGGSQEAARRFAYSKPFTRFVRAAGQPRELRNRERWVMQALQAQENIAEDEPRQGQNPQESRE